VDRLDHLDRPACHACDPVLALALVRSARCTRHRAVVSRLRFAAP
jgi:hypothetical protein